MAKKAEIKSTAKTKKTVKENNSKAKITKTPIAKTTAKKTETKKAVVQKTVEKKTTATKPKTSKTSKSSAKSSQIVEVISPSKKLRKLKGYGKEELEHFKKIILDKRTEIIEQLQNLKDQMMDPATGEYVNENSPYSLHMAEQGTDAMEREKIFLWAQRENKFLGYLEDALQRIDNGTYGICIECIDEPQNLCPTCPLIPKERLEAVPHTQHCLQIKQKQERKH